jgi:hypothetical protein
MPVLHKASEELCIGRLAYPRISFAQVSVKTCQRQQFDPGMAVRATIVATRDHRLAYLRGIGMSRGASSFGQGTERQIALAGKFGGSHELLR